MSSLCLDLLELLELLSLVLSLLLVLVVAVAGAKMANGFHNYLFSSDFFFKESLRNQWSSRHWTLLTGCGVTSIDWSLL